MIASPSEPGPYRVLVEDRLAMETEAAGLDSVLVAIRERLDAIDLESPDADLAVWRSGRIEAVAHWRAGRLADVTRFGLDPIPSRRGPRVTIGSMMLVILIAAPILAALRTSAGVRTLAGLVMIGLFGAVAGSLLMSIHHVVSFFRNPSS